MKNGNYVVRLYEGVPFSGRIDHKLKGIYAMDSTNRYVYFPKKIWSSLPLAPVE